ncbi:MAG: hypothetical protein ACOVQ0_06120 [Novosphingobium sp.]|uniref:hypothetical protein n=1 Tax=Novosphingobium sp. TaxID=1874826 RepID=UPI003B9C4114
MTWTVILGRFVIGAMYQLHDAFVHFLLLKILIETHVIKMTSGVTFACLDPHRLPEQIRANME